jgi:hypothetical protein
MVKVGVLLGQDQGNLTEWLADASAFDAAGADALWVDCGPDGDCDVLSLAAALAVVTFRSHLVVALPEAPAARTVHTIGRLSRDRFVVMDDHDGSWERVPVPEGREAWQATCTDAAERGLDGVVVPADPRLLDILRNPEDPGERHDLHLAQG